MRLTDAEVRVIKQAVHHIFGSHARVILFGSRVDDRKRGGDIDLLVEHDLSVEPTELIRRKFRAMTAIQLALGDQKIDMATAPLESQGEPREGEGEPLVVRKARQEGILL